MACSLGSGICVCGSNDTIIGSKRISNLGVSFSNSVLQLSAIKSADFPILRCNFLGQSLVIPDPNGSALQTPTGSSIDVQASSCASKAMRWWEKTMKANMVEIHSANEFVETLKNGGNRLVIVDFYSPGCGGCRALHPKICQLAESNPDAIFVKVNYEEMKTMCHALHIHVLPFFRFYRGSEGRVCSFSCTLSTIKKFKDALAKHSTERCGLGPAKGLDESELVKLASMGQIPLVPSLPPMENEKKIEDFIVEGIEISGPLRGLESQQDHAVLVT